MKPILPVLLKDFYKVGHKFQYPSDTTLVYSNLTPRGSRVPGVEGVIAFGMQYLVKEYFIDQFTENFFKKDRDTVVKAYKRIVDNCLGPGTKVDHVGELHELGYLPLLVKAVPEGTLVPFRVPLLTIRNTDKRFFWLTNMVETLLSNVLWQPITSATTSFGYRKVFEAYAKNTGSDPEFVKWQGHDFSYRGLPGLEAACLSAAAHLLSFTGTDTIPAVPFLEEYYGADSDKELVGGSVPATEHSVMSMGLQDGEFETLKRLITEVYPTGVISIVSDTWDFWRVVTDYLPRLKPEIMARAGKVVVRPDSGDPVKIICGDPDAHVDDPAYAGAIRHLYRTFDGPRTATGHRAMDPHIGLIYGDSITPARQGEILSKLDAMNYASSNVVLGIGSYTFQYVTRDTFGLAMKATYGERAGKGQAIFKAPKTDDGLKNSAKGLLHVGREFPEPGPIEGCLYLRENCEWEDEGGGALQTIFLGGCPRNIQTLAQIRRVVESQL